jgi:lipopolysaccharide assembly outer membrane protein LptD (OstA)
LCFLSVSAFSTDVFAAGYDLLKFYPADSLASAKKDTTLAADTVKKKKSDVDSVIYSNGTDSLLFFVNKKMMKVYGQAELRYKTTNLKSEKISVDFATNDIEAVGVPDSLNKKGKGFPVLMEGSEKYEGERMRYNFKTLKGFITLAGTKSEGTAYSGIKIKKMDKDTYFVQNGIYTTCDADTPHYCFYGAEMKVIQKEQIVGKWIWLTFGGVPFPIPLPFAVFPIESGRRSGLIAPTFGEKQGAGKSFSGFGYFWAINDYTDLKLTGDYYTKGGFGLRSYFRYAKRYDLSGNISLGYSNTHTGEIGDPARTEQKEWQLSWSHSQTIDPETRFNANLSFQSSDYYKNNSANLTDQLNQTITSNATFFKSWDEAGSSLSLSYSRTQYLRTGVINEVLPDLNFSKSQFYPFKGKGADDANLKWYELIGLNYSGEFRNNRNSDTSGLNIRGGIQHNLSTSISPKIGYFNISPNISYREYWYNKRIVKRAVRNIVPSSAAKARGLYESASDSVINYTVVDDIISEDKNEINMVRTFGFGLSASTKFFGMFKSPIAGIEAFRHTVTPSISYNYQPDFSDDKWGYYDYYTDSKGKRVKYSKFEKEIFGGASQGESQSISFNLGNNFEMKTSADPTDTTSKENKIQILNLNAGISYNFAADSMKFSNLNLNYRTQVGDFVNLSGNSTFSLYDKDSLHRVNKFLINNGKGLMELTRFDFALSTSLSADKFKSASDKKKEEQAKKEEESAYTTTQGVKTTKGIYEQKEADFSVPWDISLSYNYSYSKELYRSTINSNISGSLNFNLTPAWKISVSGGYDITNREVTAPQIVISRDLHCWLMNFTWNPVGAYTGYRFELRIKAPQLQDLKVTKQDDFYEGRR